jgi:hypothetical protein
MDDSDNTLSEGNPYKRQKIDQPKQEAPAHIAAAAAFMPLLPITPNASNSTSKSATTHSMSIQPTLILP